MKNIFTRAAAIAAASCLALTSGCKSKTGSVSVTDTNGNVPGSTISSDGQSEIKYTVSEFKFPSDIGSLRLFPCSGFGSFVGIGDKKVYNVSADLKTYSEIKLEFPDEYTSADTSSFEACASQTGEIYAIATLEDHNGMKLPEKHDESFDYNAYYENCINTYMFLRFDNSGKLLSKTNINVSESTIIDNTLITQGITAPGGGYALMLTADSSVAKIGADGTFDIVYEPSGNVSRASFVRSGTGQLLLCNIVLTGNNEQLEIHTFDADKGETGSATFDVPEWGSTGKGFPADGSDGYWIYLSKKDGLYAVTTDGSQNKILEWNELDLTTMSVLPMGENKFFGMDYDNKDGVKYYIFTPSDGSESGGDANEPQVITIGVFGTDFVKEKVADFNRTQREYHVRMMNYLDNDAFNPDDTTAGFNKGLEMLKNDIVSGSAPDIVMTADHELLSSLSRHGAFADLYEFMESDSEVNRDTILPNVLQACENNSGQLYYLPDSFCLETIFVKKKFHDIPTWTLDDLLDFYENPPVQADHLFDRSSRNEFISNTITNAVADFVDFDKGTCDLNNDKFIRLIELCKRFPDHPLMPEDLGIAPDSQEYLNFWRDVDKWFENDRVLATIYSFRYFSDYASATNHGASEPVTLVGYPTADGYGSRLSLGNAFSISASSKNKEGAWKFLRSYFTHDYQGAFGDDYNPENLLGIPVNAKAFDEWADHMTCFREFDLEKNEWYTTTTKKHKLDGTVYTALSQGEVDEFKKYVLGCNKLSSTFWLVNDESKNNSTKGLSAENDVYLIITEEVRSFLAGEITASQAAEYIQERASTVVSENAL